MSRVGRSQLLKNVKVTKVMTRDPITIYRYESIGKARSLMRRHNIGRLIVLDRDGKPVGMVTEDDILRKIYKPKRRMTLGEVVGEKIPRMSQLVSLIMGTPLITTDMDATIPEVARIMEKYHIRGVPIMKRGRLKGIVTRNRHYEVHQGVKGRELCRGGDLRGIRRGDEGVGREDTCHRG